MLDSNPKLKLASFVTKWMEPECNKLIMEAINKNYVHMDEHPVTTKLQVIVLCFQYKKDIFCLIINLHLPINF